MSSHADADEASVNAYPAVPGPFPATPPVHDPRKENTMAWFERRGKEMRRKRFGYGMVFTGKGGCAK